MKVSIRQLIGLFTMALIALSISTAPAHAESTTQTVTILGGVIDEQHTLGSQDPYTEASTDNGETWNPAYLVGEHPWGFVEGTNSWLNCGPTVYDCLGQTSLYRYRFFVPETYASPTLDAAFIVDNLGVITLNGTEISPGQVEGNWGTGGPIDVTSMMRSGWNELQVTLVDQGGLAGINYRLVISLQSEEEVIVAPPGSEPIQISYNANGGTMSKLSDLYKIGDPGFSLPIPDRAGWIFLGWFTDPTEGSQVPDTNYVPASTSTLHAHWVRAQQEAFSLANTGGDMAVPFITGLVLIGLGFFVARSRKII
ncbi:unannotated protein [freshwater metagenome]|uniref:Unannotated protein n=1 Tax=freshwater metagenome TaxID=449393 RepID=A0A6J7G3D1_9ZZZZ|nr:hypothetical protein [Actinomycetota bacterium]